MTSPRTYTLDELVFFTEQGMDRLPMLRAMQALGIDEDASFALGSSDSTRSKDVVRLYWDYGGLYGGQLEQYIDSVLAGRQEESAPGASRYSLGQLAWIHAAGLFRDDMVRGMLAMGIAEDVATQLAFTAARSRTVLGTRAELGQHHSEVFERYLGACLASYSHGWPHRSAVADSIADDEAVHPAP